MYEEDNQKSEVKQDACVRKTTEVEDRAGEIEKVREERDKDRESSVEIQ